MVREKLKTGKLVKIITESPDSPVHDLIYREPPETDMEYLQLLFDYVKFTHSEEENFHRLIFDGWLTHNHTEDVFPLKYSVWRKVRDIIEETVQTKMQSMAFTPRLETYIQTFNPYEQPNVRLLLLAYLDAIKENKFRTDLMDLGTHSRQLKQYIFSLNEHHKVFTDKVIELETERFSDDKSFLQKTLVLNPAMFKLFAGYALSEEEMVMLHETPVLELFEMLGPEPFMGTAIRQETGRQPHGVDEILDHGAPPFEGPEDESIETLIRFMQERERQISDSDSDDESEHDFADDIGDDLSMIDPESEIIDDPLRLNEYDNLKQGELKAYANDLEYLYGEYVWLNSLLDAKDMKNRTYLDRDDQRKITLLEQQAKKQKKFGEIRLQKSLESGFHPRLEVFSNLLGLEEEEKQILVLLLVNRLFGFENTSIGGIDVGDVLKIMYENAIERVKAKRYFMKSARLVKANIIQLESSGLSNDLMNCSIEMDNRLLEYFIGEDYDISNYVEGSMLSNSTVPLENVILPDESKNSLIEMIDHFPTFLNVKRKFDFSSVVQYGDSLVLLFVGNSGTGKTMLANALANYLKKKILLINVNDRSNLSFGHYNGDAKLSVLFREARMHDAVLFFDEAEEMLSERMNDLLIEIEKHKGIVIFATNASFTIDDALRRRINHIHRFQDPGPALRKRIWQLHLPEAVRLDPDVDLDLLAKRFEINGGLIKNAVFSALAKAAGEYGENMKLTMRHLSEGAVEQLGNKLFMSKLEEHVVPKLGLDSIVLPEKTKETLEELVNMEKARKVLIGEWGFDETFPDHNGVAVLLHGPSGTGKTKTAEALAYETGKKLKIVNYAQVVSMWVGGTEKALETLFKEVANEDTILLFDEADALFSRRVGVTSSNDRFVNIETDVLLRMVERFNSMAILTTNVLDHIDTAFLRRMQYIIEFKRPTENLRKQLWEHLVPEKLPIADDVDYEVLARQFEFTGGEIKKAIFRAATKLAVKLDIIGQLDMDTLITACKDVDGTKEKHNRPIGFVHDSLT
jgi:SpoVK/Ycf46/Vps4 family AAA+-type ATPase